MNQITDVVAARWIFPMVGDPIQGGWVRTAGGQIVEVGRGAMPAGAVDLGDAVLLPGLVNAHTHLEFSELTRPIGSKGISLHEWIGQVVGTRMVTTAESREEAIGKGIDELVAAGTRLAGEITTPPCQYPTLPDPLELVTFAEVLGLDPHRAGERLDAAMNHNQRNPAGAVSPHAPYSTTPETLARCIALARRMNRPLAMHVAESSDERELLAAGSGPFADALRSMGVWRDAIFPWNENPWIELIDSLAKAPRSLLIHGNYFGEKEIERISRYANLTVVHCPRTHQFFGHDRHPIDRMLAAGVGVALGTDSRASNPDLNVWHEAQFLWNHRADIAPETILGLVTSRGAAAMGRPDLGKIDIGCRPGFGYVPSRATHLEAVYADLATGEYRSIAPAKRS